MGQWLSWSRSFWCASRSCSSCWATKGQLQARDRHCHWAGARLARGRAEQQGPAPTAKSHNILMDSGGSSCTQASGRPNWPFWPLASLRRATRALLQGNLETVLARPLSWAEISTCLLVRDRSQHGPTIRGSPFAHERHSVCTAGRAPPRCISEIPLSPRLHTEAGRAVRALQIGLWRARSTVAAPEWWRLD